MSKEMAHVATRRWWSGKYDTLCGQILPADVGTRSSFSGPKCPKCRKLNRKHR